MNLIKNCEDCCGCGACESICPTQAIQMKNDERLFLYPEINDEKCIDCGLCMKVCDFQKNDARSNEVIKVYAVKHVDDTIVKESTSGGAFTAISNYFLSKNGVVYGAKLDEEMRLYHTRVTTDVARDELRGSKYFQSEMEDVFFSVVEDLKEKKEVLFVGTPCQIAGLISFLNIKKVNKSMLTTCDFFCHGVSSKRIVLDFVKAEEKKRKIKIKDLKFRSKHNGWAKASFAINNSIFLGYETDSFYPLYSARHALRDSCHKCKYTNGHVADITIFDFWGIEKIMPDFFDENGISGIWINTEKGEDIFKVIEYSLQVRETTVKESQMYNIKKTPEKKAGKDLFWKEYNQYGYTYITKKYAGHNFKGKVKILIKSILYKFKLDSIVKKIKNMSK